MLTTGHSPSDWAVLTGAGMSTDSGIPGYRGPDADPRRPMTIQNFLSHPDQRARYWARSWVGWPRLRWAEPNAGHLALARLGVGGIITQNVDGLHQAAAEEVGSSSPVIDLHGGLDRVVCLKSGHLFDRDWVQERLTALNPDFAALAGIDPIDVETAPDGDVDLEETAHFRVLNCPICGGLLKPDVVYFGDAVPAARVEVAAEICDTASGLVVLGTSLAVLSGRGSSERRRRRTSPSSSSPTVPPGAMNSPTIGRRPGSPTSSPRGRPEESKPRLRDCPYDQSCSHRTTAPRRRRPRRRRGRPHPLRRVDDP